MAEERYRGSVKSAMRVVEIFDLFERTQKPQSVQNVVDALEMPQSSVSSLMKTLRECGYLHYDAARRTYEPSKRLAFLGQWVIGGPKQMDSIRAAMSMVYEQTGDTVLLGCRNGLFLHYVSVMESTHTLRFTPLTGSPRPLHGCGGGIVLLARLKDDDVRALVRRYRAEHGNGPSEKETIENVQAARSQGYFETFGMVTNGVGTISTALDLPNGAGGFSIGVGGPLSRLEGRREALRELILQAAVVAVSPT